jgi:hypothetical protein
MISHKLSYDLSSYSFTNKEYKTMAARQLGDIDQLFKSPITSMWTRVSIHNELQKPCGKFLFMMSKDTLL